MGNIKQRALSVLSRTPESFLIGFFIGFLYFGYTFFWIWSLHPLTTEGVTNYFISFTIVGLGYFLSVIVSALPWGLAGIIFTRATQITPSGVRPLFFAGIITLLEFIRSWLFGILWWGNGSSIGPYWSFGNIGYLLADFYPLNQLASLVGIFGLTFFPVLLVSSGIFFIKNCYKIVFIWGLLFAMLLVALSSLPMYRNLDIEEASVTLIQTQRERKPFYTGEETLSDFNTKLDLVIQGSGSQIIVLPEGANFSKLLADFAGEQGVMKYFAKLPSETLVIDNIKVETEETRSKVVLINSAEGVLSQYDKHILSPFGEFLPYIFRIPLFLLNLLRSTDIIAPGELTPGVISSPVSYKNSTLSIRVCSEIFSAQRGQSNLIIGLSSLAPFRGNAQLQKQMEKAAKIRALEQRKYLVWASNYGNSFVIDPQGSMISRIRNQGYEILTTKVVSNEYRTWYNLLGDWPILIVSLAISSLAFKRRN